MLVSVEKLIILSTKLLQNKKCSSLLVVMFIVLKAFYVSCKLLCNIIDNNNKKMS